MQPAPEWTSAVEQSLLDVVGTVRADGRNAEAQRFWRFLQRGGRLPSGRLLRAALAGPPIHEMKRNAEGEFNYGRVAPDFAGAPLLQSTSTVGHHLVALTVQGEVLCTERPRRGLVPVPLPWPAAAVSCGVYGVLGGERENCFAAAVRRGGGAVCQWVLGLDRDDDGVFAAEAIVQEVRGLPSVDAVVALEAGRGITAALTASGAAYCWGHKRYVDRIGAGQGVAARIAALSGRRIRRLACGKGVIFAETEGDDLVVLNLSLNSAGEAVSVEQLAASGVAFPLRQLMIARRRTAIAIDAGGAIWWVRMHNESDSEQANHLSRWALPQGFRAVRMAGRYPVFAMLTESEELFITYSRSGYWGRVIIEAPHEKTSQGLLPLGYIRSGRLLLVDDASCGKARLRLFARVAVRLGLPSDPLRVTLLRAAVQSCHIVGPENDPFGRPARPQTEAS